MCSPRRLRRTAFALCLVLPSLAAPAVSFAQGGTPVEAFRNAFVAAYESDRDGALAEGRTLLLERQYEEGRQLFAMLVRENPEDIEARRWLARSYALEGDFAEAEERYRAILRDRPRDVETRLGLADALLGQKHTAEARAILLQLRNERPSDPEVLARLGARPR